MSISLVIKKRLVKFSLGKVFNLVPGLSREIVFGEKSFNRLCQLGILWVKNSWNRDNNAAACCQNERRSFIRNKKIFRGFVGTISFTKITEMKLIHSITFSSHSRKTNFHFPLNWKRFSSSWFPFFIVFY